MEKHISFYKIYIFRFTDFNGMQNKNAKPNIVNSMWREYLKGCSIYKICDKLILEHIAIFTGKHRCLFTPFKFMTKLQTFKLATLLK